MDILFWNISGKQAIPENCDKTAPEPCRNLKTY